MGYAGLERALIVVQCKDNSEIYTERLYFNQIDFQQIKVRASNIIFSNNIPDKINDKHCDWCDHRYNCEELETASMEEATCGNCHYHGWIGTQNYCLHEKHLVAITKWGANCPEWAYMVSREKREYEKIPVDVARDRLGIPTVPIVL